MRIAIDATSIPPKPAGAGIYAIELVRAMMERDRHDGYALFARGHWLDADAAGRKNWRVEHVDASTRPARMTWEQARLPRALAALRIDVLHSTHHTLPLRSVSARRVVTIHDVTFFRIPERYPPARRLYMQTVTRFAARVADAIIVPSDTVRDDLHRTLGTPLAKIVTVYEAAGAQYQPVPRADAEPAARRYGIEPPYVLSVGSLEPGKNHGRLVRAIRRLRDDGADVRLVLAGQKAWRYEETAALIDQLGMREHVVFPGYVAAADLPALYSAAAAVALPSLYEGFGLPVLEAMACGSPVVTSNISATAEVAGDAALLVDPFDSDAIAGALKLLLSDADLRTSLSLRGLKRASEFSWRRAADETHAVYERVVHPEPA